MSESTNKGLLSAYREIFSAPGVGRLLGRRICRKAADGDDRHRNRDDDLATSW